MIGEAELFLLNIQYTSYAGWIGTIAASHDHEDVASQPPSLAESSSRLAAVAGTSTCHLVQVSGA